MKKSNELYIHKILFINKLVLVIVLLFVVVRAVLIPEGIERSLAPASALGGDIAYVNQAVVPSFLSLEDCAEIIKRNPFGISGRTSIGKWTSMSGLAGSGSSVSEKLGLALFGTISGNPSVSRAIIKNLKTNELDLYKIGQTIADAYIENINTDAVTLAHNGERKILRLNASRSGGEYDTKVFSSSAAAEEKTTEITDISTEYRKTNFKIIRRCIQAILRKGVVELHAVDGRIEGLKITGIEDVREARDIGLKDGDVIHSVNGQRLTSKQKAYQVFKKARSLPFMDLELLRGNETKKISFALR